MQTASYHASPSPESRLPASTQPLRHSATRHLDLSLVSILRSRCTAQGASEGNLSAWDMDIALSSCGAGHGHAWGGPAGKTCLGHRRKRKDFIKWSLTHAQAFKKKNIAREFSIKVNLKSHMGQSKVTNSGFWHALHAAYSSTY